jgi:3-oxoacyl-[acyl-carrier protein] reductase
MGFDLGGKVALVTGASRGIGRAIAQVLSDAGCKLALNGRQSQTLEQTARNLTHAVNVSGDVTDPETAERVVSEALAALGRLDILVCNVGSGRSVPPGQESAAEWQRVFALNLYSSTNMVEAARPALAKTGGCIVCVSSICGSEVVAGAPVTYSAAKAALNAYVRGIARPLALEGIRINAVAPGNILFEGSVWDRKLSEDKAAVEAMLARDVPLGKLGTPVDVANSVAWLVSPQAQFVTGTVMIVDGGQTRSSR